MVVWAGLARSSSDSVRIFAHNFSPAAGRWGSGGSIGALRLEDRPCCQVF